MTDPGRIAGISIVCVFNDAAVRRDCLDRAIDAYSGAVSVDFVPVDNTGHQFPSAGAALNHGATRAIHDVIVFAHQDVYLHSVDRITEAATFLLDDAWGVLGANGVSHSGASVGRLRDRVQLIGDSSAAPTEVDSLDEVLFMIRRDRVLQDPLSEDGGLAWHAYAVEYGLRMRSKGLRVGALNLAITHNSLTINLDKLDAAHGRIAQLYPEALPVATTCGRIGPGPSRWRRVGALRDHGWRLRWLRESGVARKLHSQLPVPVVLVDIRHDVDLLDFSAARPLYLFNFDDVGGFAEFDTKPLRLLRRERALICASSRNGDDLWSQLEQVPAAESWLVTNIGLEDLRGLRRHVDVDSCIAGVQSNGIWLAGGPVTRALPEQWSGPRAVPLRARVSARPTAVLK